MSSVMSTLPRFRPMTELPVRVYLLHENMTMTRRPCMSPYGELIGRNWQNCRTSLIGCS